MKFTQKMLDSLKLQEENDKCGLLNYYRLPFNIDFEGYPLAVKIEEREVKEEILGQELEDVIKFFVKLGYDHGHETRSNEVRGMIKNLLNDY